MSGEELEEDEEVRRKIRQLGEEMEEEEVLEKAEEKLEQMERIRERVVLRLPHHLLLCYRLARVAGRSADMLRYKESTLALATAFGYNYTNFYLEQLQQ